MTIGIYILSSHFHNVQFGHSSQLLLNYPNTLETEPSRLSTASTMDSSTPITSTQLKCTAAVPDSNGYVPPSSCNANYGFYPSFEWNLAFAVFFGMTTLAHLIQMFVYRKVRPFFPL